MKRNILKKLKSRAGETIAETLVALLIAALALVMLAGAMSSSSRVIVSSKNKLDAYYSENEKDAGIVKKDSGTVNGTITISDGASEFMTSPVTYYENPEFSIVAYEKN